MSFTFRDGFTGGAIVAAALGIYLAWLWQADHQVRLHTAHFLRQIEKRDWTAIQGAIAENYGDDWGDDRERFLERMREVLRFTRDMRIHSLAPQTSVEGRNGSWTARIEIEGNNSEIMAEIKHRVNSLGAPFELRWRHQSGKPWDWKLTHVSNRELKIADTGY